MITHTSPFLFEMLIFGGNHPLNIIKYGVCISSRFLAQTGANHHVL